VIFEWPRTCWIASGRARIPSSVDRAHLPGARRWRAFEQQLAAQRIGDEIAERERRYEAERAERAAQANKRDRRIAREIVAREARYEAERAAAAALPRRPWWRWIR